MLPFDSDPPRLRRWLFAALVPLAAAAVPACGDDDETGSDPCSQLRACLGNCTEAERSPLCDIADHGTSKDCSLNLNTAKIAPGCAAPND